MQVLEKFIDKIHQEEFSFFFFVGTQLVFNQCAVERMRYVTGAESNGWLKGVASFLPP